MDASFSTNPGRASARHAPPCFCVVLYTGAQRWAFSWDPGEEGALLDRLEALAADEGAAFDWADAAIVSRQVARELGIVPGSGGGETESEVR